MFFFVFYPPRKAEAQSVFFGAFMNLWLKFWNFS